MILEKLIAKCLQNDRTAQRQLYENYKDALYTIVYRITGDFEISNDILQETFIDAFKSLNNLKETKFFYSWIRKILIRKSYAYLRSKKETESLDQSGNTLVNQEQPLDVEYIEKAIQNLPFKSRTIFVMIEIEGFSHKEVAEALDISVGTSKSQLNYAKTKLKKILKPYLVD